MENGAHEVAADQEPVSVAPLSLPPINTDSPSSEDRPPSPYTESYQNSPMAPLLSSYEDPDTAARFSRRHNSRFINMSNSSLPGLAFQQEKSCWSACWQPFAIAGRKVQRAFGKVKWSNIFTFPIKCCFAAIAVGMIKPVKSLLVGPTAPLAIVKESLETMGGAMIPAMMMVLGANLAKGPPPCQLPLFNIIAVAVVRLLIAPMVGVTVVIVSVHTGVVQPPDSFFMFVLMLQHCMPTAINMHTVATLHQNGVAEVTTVLFWQYLASIITVPCWMMFFLYYLRTYSPFAV